MPRVCAPPASPASSRNRRCRYIIISLLPSKSDLICAFLEERHRRWLAWFDDSVARHGNRRRSNLAAVADALAEWFADPGFRGCAFINATAELTEARSREHAIVAAHKEDLRQRLAALAQVDGLTAADEAGSNLVLQPRCGLLFLDFQSGEVLQLRGTATIDWHRTGSRAPFETERSWTFHPQGASCFNPRIRAA